MPNMNSIINTHNKTIISKSPSTREKNCNCNKPNECPLNGECLTKEIVYEGVITSNLPNYGVKRYKGITEHPFKTRYANHLKSMNHAIYKNDTELSKEYWNIKEKGGLPEIK